jgi:hypothetical protein
MSIFSRIFGYEDPRIAELQVRIEQQNYQIRDLLDDVAWFKARVQYLSSVVEQNRLAEDDGERNKCTEAVIYGCGSNPEPVPNK